jgi:hypothetical protein
LAGETDQDAGRGGERGVPAGDERERLVQRRIQRRSVQSGGGTEGMCQREGDHGVTDPALGLLFIGAGIGGLG